MTHTLDHIAQEAARFAALPENRTLKQNMDDVGTNKSAFKSARYQGIQWANGDNTAFMEDTFGKDKTAIHFKVRAGYAVKVYLQTARQDSLYHGNHTTDIKAAFKAEKRSNDFVSGWNASSSSPTINNQYKTYSHCTIILREDDYISFDIEDRVSGIAGAKVVVNGETTTTTWTYQGTTHGKPFDTDTWVQVLAISDVSKSAAGVGSGASGVGGHDYDEEARQQEEQAENAEEAAEDAETPEEAQEAAEEAQEASEQAQNAADAAQNQADASGSAEDQETADNAQSAADNAQSAADNAQSVAGGSVAPPSTPTIEPTTLPTSSMEELFNTWKAGEESGISAWRDGGTWKFVSAALALGGGQDEGDLYLIDRDVIGTSGAWHITVEQGYEVQISMVSENNNYFEENVLNKGLVEIEDTSQFTDSRMVVTLKDGDWISMDLDAEVGGIATFRINIDGIDVQVPNPEEIDNEVWVHLNHVKRTGDVVSITDPSGETTTQGGAAPIGEEGIDDIWLYIAIGIVLLLVVGGGVVGS